ncbi:hypothetical protein BHM03_00049277 [Ensete ventricosum]|nr:hypothetical protein BHM03_00049277 [Ensete ventricosum]
MDLNTIPYRTVRGYVPIRQLTSTRIARFRAVSTGKQKEEHDDEEDKAMALVGRRRHDKEGSWTWRDTKKRSVEWDTIGGGSSLHRAVEGRGIMAVVVREVAVDGKGRGPSLGWSDASPSRCHLGLLPHSRRGRQWWGSER